MGPYGGYLVPESSSSSSSDSVSGDASGTQEVGGVAGRQQQRQEEVEEEGEEEKKSAAVTLPYVAQDNLELLTVDLVERCLDSTYKGGDLLGQHPETGEDVGVCV